MYDSKQNADLESFLTHALHWGGSTGDIRPASRLAALGQWFFGADPNATAPTAAQKSTSDFVLNTSGGVDFASNGDVFVKEGFFCPLCMTDCGSETLLIECYERCTARRASDSPTTDGSDHHHASASPSPPHHHRSGTWSTPYACAWFSFSFLACFLFLFSVALFTFNMCFFASLSCTSRSNNCTVLCLFTLYLRRLVVHVHGLSTLSLWWTCTFKFCVFFSLYIATKALQDQADSDFNPSWSNTHLVVVHDSCIRWH